LNREEYGITGKRLLTRVFRENRDYLWPIPATEIEINNSLEQNPNW
jgi:starch-binding outer membrane protein, SusD/RagB family